MMDEPYLFQDYVVQADLPLEFLPVVVERTERAASERVRELRPGMVIDPREAEWTAEPIADTGVVRIRVCWPLHDLRWL